MEIHFIFLCFVTLSWVSFNSIFFSCEWIKNIQQCLWEMRMSHDRDWITLQFMQLAFFYFNLRLISAFNMYVYSITRELSYKRGEKFMCCSFYQQSFVVESLFHPHKCFMTKILTPNKLRRWKAGKFTRVLCVFDHWSLWNCWYSIETPNVLKLAL